MQPKLNDEWIEYVDGLPHRMRMSAAKLHLDRCTECAYHRSGEFQCPLEDKPCGEKHWMVRDMGIVAKE